MIHHLWIGSCEAGDNYAGQLKDLLVHSCPKRIAGFFAESIQVTKKFLLILLLHHGVLLVGCGRNSSVSQELSTSSCGDDKREGWLIRC